MLSRYPMARSASRQKRWRPQSRNTFQHIKLQAGPVTETPAPDMSFLNSTHHRITRRLFSVCSGGYAALPHLLRGEKRLPIICAGRTAHACALIYSETYFCATLPIARLFPSSKPHLRNPVPEVTHAPEIVRRNGDRSLPSPPSKCFLRTRQRMRRRAPSPLPFQNAAVVVGVVVVDVVFFCCCLLRLFFIVSKYDLSACSPCPRKKKKQHAKNRRSSRQNEDAGEVLRGTTQKKRFCLALSLAFTQTADRNPNKRFKSRYTVGCICFLLVLTKYCT